MENKDVELRSPKVRNIIGKMPRGLVFSAVFIYLIVFLLILAIVYRKRRYFKPYIREIVC